MILSILATVAVLAAIATIAAALLLAETTLVYFALGLGGISVLLLLAALIQGGVRAAGQERTRTGTDGLGKSSVPAVATTAATPPGAHDGPEDSGRVPAPAHGPVRDSVVSEHGTTGFTPVTGDRPETATGSPDPDPARPHAHPPAEDAGPLPEPERFDYRIPHQGRTEDRTWAAEPGTEGTEPFSDWTPTRPDEPGTADGTGPATPADDAPAEAGTSADSGPDAASDVARPVAADAAEEPDSADRTDACDDNADEAPRFNYRVPTADATDDVEPYPDGTEAGGHDAHDDAPAPTGSAVVEADAGSVEPDTDQAEEAAESGEPAEARDSVEPAEAGADADGTAFSYRVPTAESFEDEVDAGTAEPVETTGAVEPVEASDTAETTEPVDASDTAGSTQPAEEPGTGRASDEPAEAERDTGATEIDTEQTGDPDEPDAGTSEHTGARDTVDVSGTAEPAEAPGTVEDTESGADDGGAGFSYRVTAAGDADETAAFSYRVPDTGTDGAAEPRADGAAAFSYRVPVADTDDDSPVAYAAILDPDDEPPSSDGPSRRQDPDQVS